MVSNNSSGAHSLGLGIICKYIHSFEFIYSDSKEEFARDNHCDPRMKEGFQELYPIITTLYPSILM